MLRYIKDKIRSVLVFLKQPRILTGYKDSTGVYRRNTYWSDSIFFGQRRNIKIADYVYLGHYCLLDGTGGIEIDEGTQLGHWIGVFTHSSHMAIRFHGRSFWDVPVSQRKAYSVRPVKIGKYVFVGSRTMILPGVTIGDGCIIKPGSFIKYDVPARSIVEGDPARITGSVDKIDFWHLRSEPNLRESYFDQEFILDNKEKFSKHDNA